MFEIFATNRTSPNKGSLWNFFWAENQEFAVYWLNVVQYIHNRGFSEYI